MESRQNLESPVSAKVQKDFLLEPHNRCWQGLKGQWDDPLPTDVSKDVDIHEASSSFRLTWPHGPHESLELTKDIIFRHSGHHPIPKTFLSAILFVCFHVVVAGWSWILSNALVQTQVIFTVIWATEVTLWPAATVHSCNPISLSHIFFSITQKVCPSLY